VALYRGIPVARNASLLSLGLSGWPCSCDFSFFLPQSWGWSCRLFPTFLCITFCFSVLYLYCHFFLDSSMLFLSPSPEYSSSFTTLTLFIHSCIEEISNLLYYTPLNQSISLFHLSLSPPPLSLSLNCLEKAILCRLLQCPGEIRDLVLLHANPMSYL
jgi:hypothetical protein